jgi:Tfp pilus assembly protein PilN
MIAFDFLYDPRTVLLERLRAFKMTKALVTASTALGTVAVVVIGGWLVQHARVAGANADVAALEARYSSLRERLVRERLEAGEVADLGTVDGRLRAIASSGSRACDRLVMIATVLPNDAWLVSLSDDGKNVVMIGRTTSLSGVASAISRMARVRLGVPTLARVARIERSGRPLLEFSLSLDET